MLCGGKVLTLSRYQSNTLMSIEIDFWLRVAKKSRKETSRNLKIKEIINIQQSIIKVMEEKLLKFGHLKRMKNDIVIKMILE